MTGNAAEASVPAPADAASADALPSAAVAVPVAATDPLPAAPPTMASLSLFATAWAYCCFIFFFWAFLEASLLAAPSCPISAIRSACGLPS